MSMQKENVEVFVGDMIAEDKDAMKASLNETMLSKIASAIEAKKQEIAQTFFKAE